MNWTRVLAGFLSFEGRVPRNHFWFAQALSFVFFLVIPWFDETSGAGWIGAMFFLVVSVWVSLASQVRRWHDLGRSGYWALLNFVPFVGAIYSLIVLGCYEGEKGPNRYGPPPASRPA